MQHVLASKTVSRIAPSLGNLWAASIVGGTSCGAVVGTYVSAKGCDRRDGVANSSCQVTMGLLMGTAVGFVCGISSPIWVPVSVGVVAPMKMYQHFQDKKQIKEKSVN